MESDIYKSFVSTAVPMNCRCNLVLVGGSPLRFFEYTQVLVHSCVQNVQKMHFRFLMQVLEGRSCETLPMACIFDMRRVQIQNGRRFYVLVFHLMIKSTSLNGNIRTCSRTNLTG